MGRRVLITGVGSHVGSLLAQCLERDPEVEHVAGLDTIEERLPKRRTGAASSSKRGGSSKRSGSSSKRTSKSS